MKIGIDLRALQNGHKYRGIGEVAKQVANRIIKLADPREVSFVFYEYEGAEDPKKLLDVPKAVSFDVVTLGPMPEDNPTETKIEKIKRNARDLYGYPFDASESDVFLQFDFAAGVPKNTKTVLIKHDLIPYLFWDKYFTSAWVHFKNKAARTTLRTLFHNHKFMQLLRRSLKNADLIISNSQNTKKDIEKHFGVNEEKSKVALLGVDIKPAKTTQDLPAEENMPTKPYLLFVGAGDARRKVEDLVAAFNNLKADGRDIQLVLVGENFQAPEKIPNTKVRQAVLTSSYKKDIVTMGYVDDATKQHLFKNAISYVYPTRYEGFGIPVLEAMLLECPIIVYKNSSIPEVGGEYTLYAESWQDIKRSVERLMNELPEERQKHLRAAKKHAEQFTWDKTAKIVFEEIQAIGK